MSQSDIIFVGRAKVRTIPARRPHDSIVGYMTPKGYNHLQKAMRQGRLVSINYGGGRMVRGILITQLQPSVHVNTPKGFAEVMIRAEVAP